VAVNGRRGSQRCRGRCSVTPISERRVRPGEVVDHRRHPGLGRVPRHLVPGYVRGPLGRMRQIRPRVTKEFGMKIEGEGGGEVVGGCSWGA